jgi:signal transduction histidine kinase
VQTEHLQLARRIYTASQRDTLAELCKFAMLLAALWLSLTVLLPDQWQILTQRRPNLINLALLTSVCLLVVLLLKRTNDRWLRFAAALFVGSCFAIAGLGVVLTGFGIKALAPQLLVIVLVFVAFHYGIRAAAYACAASLLFLLGTACMEWAGKIRSASPGHQPLAFVAASTAICIFILLHLLYRRFEHRFGLLSALLDDQRSQLVSTLDTLKVSLTQKRAFTGTLSHATRTPLAGIQFALQILARERLPEPVRERTVKALVRNAHRLKMMVQQLDIAVRLNAQEVSLLPTPIDLQGLRRALLTCFQTEAALRSVTLSVHIAPALMTTHLLADARVLTHLLNILVDNALKAQTGGGVNVRIGPSVNSVSEIDGLLIEVEDSGSSPLPQDNLSLFVALDQLQQRPADAASDGLGLGLAIIRALSELSGGKFGCRPSESTGNVFWVQVPATGGLSGHEVAA